MSYLRLFLQLLLFVSSVSAFYPYYPEYKCIKDGNCPEAARSRAGANVFDSADFVNHGYSVKIRQIVPTDASSHSEKVERYANNLVERFRFRYGAKKAPEKRANGYLIQRSNPTTTPNSAPIDQDGEDFSYMATVYLGSNKKPLEMLLDTGAASSWVMGSSCKDAACTRHDTYGPSDSTAYNATGDTFEVKYGTGVVKGSWIQDDVTFADMAVSFSFGVADEVSDHFSNFPMDGILGLAQNAGLAPPTFLATLVSNKVLQSNIFAVNLHRSSDGTNDGEITFGSVDQSKFVGDITYTPIVKPGGSWIIKSDDAGVGGKKAGLVGKDVVIDTGTSYVFLPPADAKLFYATMEGAFEDAAGGSYSVPCDTTQTAQFTFGGVTYEVSPKDWIGGSTGKGSYCTSNIYSRDATGMNMWLMGDTFLKNVYSVFDVDQNRIGFAKKPSGPVPTSTSGSSSTTSIGGQALLSSQGVPFPGRPDSTLLVSSVSSPQMTYSDMYSEASSSPSPTLPSSTTNIATSSVETSNDPSITESSSSDSSQTTSPPSTTMLPGSQGFEAVITSGTTVTTEETTAPAPPPPSEVQPDAPATTTADGAASSISICLTAYSVVIFAAFAAIL